VTDERPRSAHDVDGHRRAGRALEHEIAAVDAHDLGRRIPALAHVAHEVGLARGNVASPVATQDGPRIEREHVRVATVCERL
jgi:hypothetical protein